MAVTQMTWLRSDVLDRVLAEIAEQHGESAVAYKAGWEELVARGFAKFLPAAEGSNYGMIWLHTPVVYEAPPDLSEAAVKVAAALIATLLAPEPAE